MNGRKRDDLPIKVDHMYKNGELMNLMPRVDAVTNGLFLINERRCNNPQKLGVYYRCGQGLIGDYGVPASIKPIYK